MWALPPEEFGGAVARIIAGWAEFGFEPIFVGIPPFDELLDVDVSRVNAVGHQLIHEAVTPLIRTRIAELGQAGGRTARSRLIRCMNGCPVAYCPGSGAGKENQR